MGVKLATFLAAFIVLVGLNLFLGARLVHKNRLVMDNQKILAEIDQASKNESQFHFNSTPLVMGNYEANVTIADGRAQNLKAFFRKYNSPLYDQADHIVAVSDKYGFDYRLLPSIAMQESTLCKFIPEGSHNCWGWGIYGDQTLRFDSYEEAIETVAAGIKASYIDHGLVTASAIMQKYTPSSPNGAWAKGVNTVLGWLE